MEHKTANPAEVTAMDDLLHQHLCNQPTVSQAQVLPED
jgi:hypothetical protein